MKTVSKNIKFLRQKMGWTQRKVAEILRISVLAFSKIETGIADVSINRLCQIADLFKVSIVDMFSSDVRASNQKIL